MNLDDDFNDSQQQSGALADFLRAMRERRLPEDFGLPIGQRRRTKGLRREEVASLCGISSTWYTWIEQGRTTSVSVASLVGLALGLRMSEAERAYLFQLAGRADPAHLTQGQPEIAPYADLLTVISSPAYMLDRYWNAIAWNQAAAELFEDWLNCANSKSQAARPNLLRYVFLDAAAPNFILDWENRVWRLVAEYRAESAGLRHDLAQQALIAELQATSSVFRQAWRSQKVLAREGGSRGFLVPKQGCRYFWQYSLRMSQQVDVKLIVLVPQ